MEVVYYVPTLKTKSKDYSRDERLQIYTLFHYTSFTINQIYLQLGKTPNQVQYALSYRLTPQKHRGGCKVLLNTLQRKRLIAWVIALKENRETKWVDIPPLLG